MSPKYFNCSVHNISLFLFSVSIYFVLLSFIFSPVISTCTFQESQFTSPFSNQQTNSDFFINGTPMITPDLPAIALKFARPFFCLLCLILFMKIHHWEGLHWKTEPACRTSSWFSIADMVISGILGLLQFGTCQFLQQGLEEESNWNENPPIYLNDMEIGILFYLTTNPWLYMRDCLLWEN